MPVAALPRLTVVTDVRELARERGWRYTPGVPAGVQRLEPSRTTPEQVAETRARLGTWTQSHRELAHGRPASDIEAYYRRLLEPTERPYPETFLCEVPDALVSGTLGAVVTAQGEILAQSLSHRRAAAAAKVDAVKATTGGVDAAVRAGTYVSLIGIAADGYAHWLLDLLPRLALVPAGETDFSVLVPAEPGRFELELLELLGISGERVVPVPATHIRVERLLLSSPSHRLTRPVKEHFEWLRGRLLSAAGGEPGEPRRVYVSRARASRRVRNESELAPVLARFGFETVIAEELPVVDQIRLFARAGAIAGAHGAGIFNHLFARDRAKVIELFNPEYFYTPATATALLLGQEHWHLFGEPAGPVFDVVVDPSRFEELLDLALGS